MCLQRKPSDGSEEVRVASGQVSGQEVERRVEAADLRVQEQHVSHLPESPHLHEAF